MLFLEERYVKIIGSVLALGLAAAVLFTAVSAAALSKDAVKTAQSIDIDEESSEEEAPGSVTVKHDIDITPSLSEKASSSESERKPVEQVKGQKDCQQSPAASTQKTEAVFPRDIWLMAQLIYAEGRGESLEGAG